VRAQRASAVASGRRTWIVRVSTVVGVLVVFLTAARASTIFHQEPKVAVTTAPASAGLAPAVVSPAVNSLLAAVKASARDDRAIPSFAKDRISWIAAHQHAGTLSIVLLNHPGAANLDPDALMASGEVDGRQVIVISRPRFAAFLIENGPTAPPFSRRERNDFLLGLVHETVHLERSGLDPHLSLEDRLREEERAWRSVDVNVVRPLLAQDEPMNPRFIEADEAIRSCGDHQPCQPLRTLLAQAEIGRR
jgi:hypothetical protein